MKNLFVYCVTAILISLLMLSSPSVNVLQKALGFFVSVFSGCLSNLSSNLIEKKMPALRARIITWLSPKENHTKSRDKLPLDTPSPSVVPLRYDHAPPTSSGPPAQSGNETADTSEQKKGEVHDLRSENGLRIHIHSEPDGSLDLDIDKGR